MIELLWHHNMLNTSYVFLQHGDIPYKMLSYRRETAQQGAL